mmetsp:Transcript_12000/g.18110  ORF Transcript_12000/g.18110 Transcript_12000/m.18110 type:complete len:111 (+) Transcript_12000:108-440(+)
MLDCYNVTFQFKENVNHHFFWCILRASGSYVSLTTLLPDSKNFPNETEPKIRRHNPTKIIRQSILNSLDSLTPPHHIDNIHAVGTERGETAAKTNAHHQLSARGDMRLRY